MALDTHFVSVLASVAGANKRHLALFNAVGSGKIIRIFSIRASGAPTAAVTGLVIPLYSVGISTVPTGGGNATFIKADPASVNLPAQITAHIAATGGAAEEASSFGCGTTSGEESAQTNETTIYQASFNGSQAFTCPEGRGILIKQGGLASAGAVSIVVSFGVS